MSNSKKRRLSFQLSANEAAIIGPVEDWQYLAELMDFLAVEYPHYGEKLSEYGQMIQNWLLKTSADNDDDNEW